MMMRPLTRAGAIAICLTAAGPGHESIAQAQLAPLATPPRQAASATTPTTPSPSLVVWQRWADSAEGRPIELVRLGQGQHQVLVVAGLRGDDPLSVALAERLASHLTEFPALVAATTVTIIRDANPDGRVRRTAVNAHGVLLEHNFSSSNWRKLTQHGQFISGRLPESEPETRALAELIAQSRPERVLLLATVATKPSLTFCGPRADWPGKIARDARLPLSAPDLAATSGSLVIFAGQDRAIPCLSAELPRASNVEALWPDVRAGLSTAVSDGFFVPAATPAPVVPLVTVAPGSGQVVRAPAGSLTPVRNVATQRTPTDERPEGTVRPFSFLLRDVREIAPQPQANISAPQASVSSGPRVLSADELSRGGTLVPVTVPASNAPPAENASPNPPEHAGQGSDISPFGRKPNRVEIRSDDRSLRPATSESQPGVDLGKVRRPPAVPVLDERALPQPPIPRVND